MNISHPNNTIKNAYANNIREGIPREIVAHLDICSECRAQMFPEQAATNMAEKIVNNKSQTLTEIKQTDL